MILIKKIEEKYNDRVNSFIISIFVDEYKFEQYKEGLSKVNNLEYIRSDKHTNEFYVALLLYELYDLDVKDLNDKIILEAHEIIDEYDSIYNEDLRDRLRDEQFIEKEEHEMER